MKNCRQFWILLSFLLFSQFTFSQQVSEQKLQWIRVYQENFDRLNAPSASPQSLKKIQKSFRKKAGKEVLVAAHRGDHMEAPENSILSFEHAIRYGTAIVELDIRNSSNDSLMIIHDSSVDRTTQGTGMVEEMSYDKLRELSLINDYTFEATAWKIPTLFESLSALKGELLIDLDIKCDKIQEIYATVEKLDMMDQVLFFCDEADMNYVLSQDPKAMVMPRARSMEELEQLMKKYDPKVIHIDDSNFDIPEAVALIRSYSKRCRVWANALGNRDTEAIQGSDEGILELRKLGVDVIQTDLPRYVFTLMEDK